MVALMLLATLARSAEVGPGSGCGLGAQWDVLDANGVWHGVWTRRPDTNTFDAVWRRISGFAIVRGVLEFHGDERNLVIDRADTSGLTDCVYRGAIDGLTASGTLTCESGGVPVGPFLWSAVIRCEAVPTQ
jgi:hypothetical protein